MANSVDLDQMLCSVVLIRVYTFYTVYTVPILRAFIVPYKTDDLFLHIAD